MNWREIKAQFQDYFHFPIWVRRATIAMLVLTILAMIANQSVGLLFEKPNYDFTAFQQAITDYEEAKKKEQEDRLAQRQKTKTHFREETEGGQEGEPDFREMISDLPNDRRDAGRNTRKNDYSGKEPFTQERKKEFKKYEPKPVVIVQINSADTADWIALRGIAEKRAAAIISYREKLGGFHSIDQLIEVYSVDSALLDFLRPPLVLDSIALRTININTATAEELKAHPYFTWNLARVVENYRKQHGPYQKKEDLLKIHLVDDGFYRKIAPYLRLND